MKLFGSYTSPYVRHCRIALHTLGISYELIETDYTGSAKGSPAMRVPFMQDEGRQFSDSSSILMYTYQLAGKAFIESPEEMELYTLVNTAMDTVINLFLLEKDGLSAEQSSYIKRQQQRVDRSLTALEGFDLPQQLPLNIGQTRLACFIAWGVFRKRINIDQRPNLKAFMVLANSSPEFVQTAPPQ